VYRSSLADATNNNFIDVSDGDKVSGTENRVSRTTKEQVLYIPFSAMTYSSLRICTLCLNTPAPCHRRRPNLASERRITLGRQRAIGDNRHSSWLYPSTRIDVFHPCIYSPSSCTLKTSQKSVADTFEKAVKLQAAAATARTESIYRSLRMCFVAVTRTKVFEPQRAGAASAASAPRAAVFTAAY
jgi:hypothetical protein